MWFFFCILLHDHGFSGTYRRNFLPLVSRLEYSTGRFLSEIVLWQVQDLDWLNCRIESQLGARKIPEDSPFANARINFLCGDVDSQFRNLLQAKEEEASARSLVVSGVNKDLKSLCDEKDLWMHMLSKDVGVLLGRLRSFTLGTGVWKSIHTLPSISTEHKGTIVSNK
jgi:hypothetical protein